MLDDYAESPDSGHDWLDRDAGPLVRAYTVTGGRTRPAGDGIDLMAFVVATAPVRGLEELALQPEHLAILARSQQPVSVAELASRLDLPVGVVRVLLDDLLQQKLIALYEPQTETLAPQPHILKAVIDGLRAL